jgi:hypothetical protein
MLLSRFWYLILSLTLAAAVGILFVAKSFYNRNSERSLTESLQADSTAVSWYMKDDARNRAAALLPVALDPELREGLAKASDADEVKKDDRAKVKKALTKAVAELPEEMKFTAVWACDAEGRVIADVGWQHHEDWNLGGYPVVADALAGWIRDDAWVLKEKLYKVVARPVEGNAGGAPVGALVGIVAIDNVYAQAVSARTGAAVAFYAMGSRVSNGAPEGFPAGDFDVLQSDLKETAATEEYDQKGRSKVRRPRDDLGLVYARIPGEAWDQGSGYVVARKVVKLNSPTDFFQKAEQTDTDSAPRGILIGIGLGLGLLGIIFSVVEHTLPLRTFRREAHRFAEAKTDTLAPSRFRGLYKKIAADINDGVDKVLSKGGITRRAADLEQVIGPLPAQPQMSAFAVPGDPATSAPSEPRTAAEKRVPGPPPKASSGGFPAVRPSDAGGPRPPPRPPGKSAPEAASEEVAAASGPVSAPSGPVDELAEWKGVYEEFLKVKKQCNEPTESLTFDKFKGTLERNKAALVSRHNCAGVKFTVYVKDGKAALRAAPVK